MSKQPERWVVAVGPAPESAGLVRLAAEMAARQGGSLIAVQAEKARGWPAEGRRQLGANFGGGAAPAVGTGGEISGVLAVRLEPGEKLSVAQRELVESFAAQIAVAGEGGAVRSARPVA